MDGDFHLDGIPKQLHHWVVTSHVVGATAFIFGNLKFQSEVSRLGLRKGWWESKNLDINWESIATCRVATTDLEPAEK